jgi:putative glycosyltransferase
MMHKNSDLRDLTREASPCELSIVTTLYRSEPFIERFLHHCAMTLSILGIADYEFVLVDDGSPDESVAKARALRHIYPGLRLVVLARNFGHHHAAVAGLHHARGRRVFLADCDMEVLPSVLHEFWQQMDTCHADVVFGYQERRKGKWAERVGGGVFWRLLNVLSDVTVATDMVTERLMTRRYVDALLTLGDRDVFLAGMMAWTGFTQIGVPVTKGQRAGPSTYTFVARARLFVRAITSSSVRPLYATYWLGATSLLGALLTFAVLITRGALGDGAAVESLPVILATIAAFSGLGLLCLGVLGSYVAHIHVQAKRRPIFIVKECD